MDPLEKEFAAARPKMSEDFAGRLKADLVEQYAQQINSPAQPAGAPFPPSAEPSFPIKARETTLDKLMNFLRMFSTFSIVTQVLLIIVLFFFCGFIYALLSMIHSDQVYFVSLTVFVALPMLLHFLYKCYVATKQYTIRIDYFGTVKPQPSLQVTWLSVETDPYLVAKALDSYRGGTLELPEQHITVVERQD